MVYIEKNKTERATKHRIVILFVCVLAVLCLMVFRLAWIQIINAEEYRDRAIRQQKGDVPIEAKRGIIYDRNGKPLAASAMSYNVWVRPPVVRDEYKGAKLEDLAEKISAVTGDTKEDIMDTLKSESPLLKMSQYLEKDKLEKLKKLEIPSLQVAEASRRSYPMGDFASHVLGSVNSDNRGRSGLELQYDDYLSGVAGRWIRNADVHGDPLAYGSEKYYEAEDGLNVVTTIDEVLQHYLETAIENGMKKYKPQSIQAVVMDPKTGDVLAMASAPSFDPNNPTSPVDSAEKKKFNKLSDKEKGEYLSKLWTNPVVSDLYEPGSTVKVVTVSSALEEEIATPDEPFYCGGNITVAGSTIHCANNVSHGNETLKEALANSCNVVMVTLAERMGADRQYKYLNLYGLTEKTGIDLPGEAYPLVPPLENLNQVTHANLAFGQGIAVTPIEMCQAVSCIANDGVLLKPRLVKELTDKNGKVIQKFPVEIKKKVISKKTAEETMSAMELMIQKNGGNVAIPGVRIAGKTGTSEKPINGVYTHYVYGSMVCIAPVDDPKFAIVIMVDSPTYGLDGGTTAGPMIKEFFEKAFPYVGVEAKLTDEEKTKLNESQSEVPTVVGKSLEEAKKILANAGLGYSVVQDQGDDSITVKGQYPQPGKKISSIEKVYLYIE
ncbi:penicillin-binding transpeptidase domain-containing protein [Anaerovoracaceae bacterium SGI.195]